MSKFRYQNSTKWWRRQWLGINLLKTRSFLFLSIIQKTSQTKFYKIWISKSKVTHVQIPVPIWEKTKIREKNFWVTKRASKGIISRAGFEDYKSGQEGLQIRARITDRCTTTLTLKSTIYFLDRKKRIAIINWTVSSYNYTHDESESVTKYGQPYIPNLLTVCSKTSNKNVFKCVKSLMSCDLY